MDSGRANGEGRRDGPSGALATVPQFRDGGTLARRSHRTMRTIQLISGLCALALMAVGCKEEQVAARTAQEPQVEESLGVAPSGPPEETQKDSVVGLPTPTAKPTPVAAVEGARQSFQNVDLPDSARVAAARRVLLSEGAEGVIYLVENYGLRDNNVIERALIEQSVAVQDEAVLLLLLGLFEHVGGEERIDFEQYLLRFGRRSESRMMALLHADDVSLVMRALDALGKMKSAAATDSIAALLNHPNSWVRIGASHALGETGGPEAVEHLLIALKDTTYSVVNAALVGLGRLRATEAYEQIMGLTGNENSHIRKHAAMALAELGDRRAIPAVRGLVEGDADAGVRFMAKKALQKLEQRPGE